MSRNIRIRTTPNGGDNQLKIQLNQDFDFLEILSLKISQEDVYRSFYSDYGVVVGRVIMNSGVGVPNTRISIFIPLTDEDAENEELVGIYPYKDLQDVNSDGIRYNTLPKDAQGICHTPIGTFPTKRELVDNPEYLEVYQKYYKYTTTTNGAGDFMLFGVPVGNYVVNVDVDLSDIGIYSQRPYDFIEQGNPKKLFESPTKFKANTNLNNLTQVKNRQVGVNVIPFWGDKQSNEIGISRIDVDLNYNISPKAIFLGSIFGDNEKYSINKNCRPRKKLGKICNMTEGEGTIQMLRKSIFGNNERYDVDGGRVITDKGTWAYQIPMNLDYMITDEFGNLTQTEDTTKGIPTRASVRFKIDMDQTGGEGRLRSRAKYLVPHNPSNISEVDYSFDESTSDTHFRDMYWNKIYTISNHIARYQKNSKIQNRNFIGFKDVDDCVGVKTPLPFNKLDNDFNPLYFILCIIIGFIVEIINLVNSIIRVKLPVIGRIFGCGSCIKITCNGNDYRPGCKKCSSSSKSQLLDCLQLGLAESLNVYEFDFYNDWLNGALYSFLFKYKKVKNTSTKYCGEDEDGNTETNGNKRNAIVNTNAEPDGKFDSPESHELDEGVIASYNDELFYKPLTKLQHKFYSTEIYNLGAVFPCDWQQEPKIQQDLIETTYQLPPLTKDTDDNPDNDVTPMDPLLFHINCTGVDADTRKSRSLRRICEIGVGLDEEPERNERIDSTDITEGGGDLLRDNLIKLNVPEYYYTDVVLIDSTFVGAEYGSYRGIKIQSTITQFERSYYFYFGTIPNNNAISLMNSKYFTDCTKTIVNNIVVYGDIISESAVNANDGSISITVIGGTPPYKTYWYDDYDNVIPNTDPDGYDGIVGGLTEGKYYVNVTDNDGNGVTTKKTFIVTSVQPLSVEVQPKSVSGINQLDGQLIFLSIIGGVKPYTVTVSGPTGTQTFNDVSYALTVDGLTNGIYQYTVTDSNTIDPGIVEGTEEIPVPDALVITNLSISKVSCIEFQDGAITFQIVGGTPDYQIELLDSQNSWYSIGLNDGVYTATNLPPESYVLKVVDNFYVSQQESFVLVEPTELILTRISFLYYVVNTVSGITYVLVDGNDNTIQTFIGDNTGTYSNSYGGDMTGFRVRTNTGCSSNIL